MRRLQEHASCERLLSELHTVSRKLHGASTSCIALSEGGGWVGGRGCTCAEVRSEENQADSPKECEDDA